MKAEEQRLMTKVSHNVLVFDTNIVSYIFNNKPQASKYVNLSQGSRIIISFQTVEELLYGAFKDGWGTSRKNQLEHQINQYEVSWSSRELVDYGARLHAEREAAGRRLAMADVWVAATAMMYGCPLVSSDKAFRNIPGLKLIE